MVSKDKISIILIIILSIIGLVFSGYLVYNHYLLLTGHTTSCFGSSACAMINASIYSEVLGIPIALFGVIGFLAILIATIKEKLSLVFYLSVAGMFFVTYLVYIELVIFREICPVCTITHIIGVLILLLSYRKSHTIYKTLRDNILFAFNAETIHNISSSIGQLIAESFFGKIIHKFYFYSHPALKTRVAGITFQNPIGLGAGFDKNATLINFIEALGFGYEEVGSVTAEASEGNPKPRLWRLPKDKSIVVNYGLANQGADIIKHRLKEKRNIPIGVSIARTNKPMSEAESIKDYVQGFKKLHKYGAYTTINVSCPNISDSQPFCYPEKLTRLLKEIDKCKKLKKPVFLKLKPDMSKKDIDGVLKATAKYKWITGFVLTNLSKSRRGLKSSKADLAKVGEGSLSGLAVQKKSDDIIKYIYEKTKKKYTIIGLGGIFTAEDAYRKIRNGASLVQLVTGLIYEGPGISKKINKGLVKLLKRDGFKNISEAIGVDAE